MSKINVTHPRTALIGSGKAAEVYLEWSDCLNVEIFTTKGGGEFHGLTISPISQLDESQFEKIVIASQFVDDIVKSWVDSGKSLEKVYWFDFLYLRLGYLPDMDFEKASCKQTLYVVYDLEVLPASFDFATFLIRAELHRKEMGLDNIALVIKAGNFAGLSARANLNHGEKNGNWRVHHILIPMAQLLPSCRDILYVADVDQMRTIIGKNNSFPTDLNCRADFNNYALEPLNQMARAGQEVRLFKAPEQAKEFVRQFINAHQIQQPFICISLREYAHQTSRNSCLEIYRRLAEIAAARGLGVVVVRDTAMAMSTTLDWKNIEECPVASFDVAIRLAIYESATLNVSVSSGPSCGLMLLSQKTDFMMTHIVDNTQWLSNEEFLEKRQGIKNGKQFPFSGKFQKICWSTDKNHIQEHFEKMLNEKYKVNYA